MSEPYLLSQQSGSVLQLHLNRIEKRNALSDELVHALRQTFENLAPEVRAVVIGAHGEHFSAGLDLSELSEANCAEGMQHSFLWYEAFRRIQFGRVPVIGVLHGAVVGGGLELASSLHVRVAEESAYFGLPEGQRGIFLGGGGSVRVSKLIGFSRVTEMMLTGHVLTAQEGHAMGLAHYVTPAGQGMAKARELARRIAGNAPLASRSWRCTPSRRSRQPSSAESHGHTFFFQHARGCFDRLHLCHASLLKSESSWHGL